MYPDTSIFEPSTFIELDARVLHVRVQTPVPRAYTAITLDNPTFGIVKRQTEC